MPISAPKNTDLVKFLAFRHLMRERADAMTIRVTLGISRATYFRYLKQYRRVLDKERRERE